MNDVTTIPAPYAHQKITTDFIVDTNTCLITSDPGTGKTRAVLDAHAILGGKTLVLAPLSILEAAWGEDINKFQPEIKYGVAYAKNRKQVFEDNENEMVITNFEAVNFLSKNTHYCEQFDTIVIDEFTAFKNREAKRSKNLKKIISYFTNRIAMSGTPNSNTILDIWHPALLIDDGKRLGTRFYAFRHQVCTPKFNGFANEWIDKPGIEEAVADKLSDISIRFALSDCIDLPDNIVRTVNTKLTPNIQKQYKTLADESVLYTKSGTVNAVNAAARVKKLLQLVTGAVYDEDGVVQFVHQERYDIVMTLVNQRAHSLVAFNWKHERDALVELANKEGITYDVIDGTVPAERRKDIVARYQAGQIKSFILSPTVCIARPYSYTCKHCDLVFTNL